MTTPSSILIVEDESIVAADIAGKLHRLGYIVAGISATGEQAVQLARAQQPALVLMDIRLAGPMDGIAAADAIRQSCDVPVIFLTAHSDQATLEGARRAEAFGYVLKPFDDRDLHTQIEMALYKHAAEQRLRESHARLTTLAEATFEGIVESEAGRIVDCNEQFARMVDYPVAELMGLEIAQLIAPEDRERVLANVQQNQASTIEHAMLRKDGTRLVVEARGRALAPGSATRHTAIRDITARQQAEAALRASNAELERFNRLLVDRELRMIELKQEVNQLCAVAGQPPHYALDFMKEPP